MDLSILYRGQLSSCNYGCNYCPFAKHFETPDELLADQTSLDRFVRWCAARGHAGLSVFFTPWGEALVRSWYRNAIASLAKMPHVRRVAVQTNLSCPLDWLASIDKTKLGIWATYHPGEVSREQFLRKCVALNELGVRFSVGVVGMKEHLDEARALRAELPANVYLWINAYKRVPDYYDSAQFNAFEAIDPLFPINTKNHPSRGLPCRAGHTVISVDGEGVARRCHFIKTPIGNIYDAGFEQTLRPRDCTNETCGCHIGYVHMPALKLYEVFGEGVLERIPTNIPASVPVTQVSINGL
jgi:MoaA/NifB/PqqE/SkfB family radical SAM enzyme